MMNRTTLLTMVCVLSASGSWADELRFETHLAPYGQWVGVAHFGRVWRPSVAVVGAEFEPYSTGGHWVYTDQGWSFESEWPFAWATFHYGRWYQDPTYGWVWAPGEEWAPSWVEWRSGGGYVGWVPMAPVGIEVVVVGYHPRWAFVEDRYLLASDPWRHRLDERRSSDAYHGATAVGGGAGRWSMGPPAAHIAVAAGVELRPTHLVTPPRGDIAPPPPPLPAANHGGVPVVGVEQLRHPNEPPAQPIHPERAGTLGTPPPPPIVAPQHREPVAPAPTMMERGPLRAAPPQMQHREAPPPPPPQQQVQPPPQAAQPDVRGQPSKKSAVMPPPVSQPNRRGTPRHR